jgi:hypothetical protein
LYQESALEVLKFLNCKPETDKHGEYNIELRINGEILENKYLYPKKFNSNPLTQTSIVIEYEKDEDSPIVYKWAIADLIKIDSKEGIIVFQRDNNVITFTKVKYDKFNIANAYSTIF